MTASLPLVVLDADRLDDRACDASRPVMLIGFQDQGNLGLGYLASTLRQYGYQVIVFDFEKDPEEILQAAESTDPILIGFSLIFQFYVLRFGALARHLRDSGITCHFTMGGHFPSLSYQHALQLVPELDSVVRFEGEVTLLELVDHLSTGREWHDIQGIAYRHGDMVVANPLRPVIADLDTLPYPERDFEPETVLGRSAMPLLASRGCARTCSFCSIHMFYRSVPGKIVRTRRPAKVAEEMRMLYDDRGITIFLFQDDDFPLFGPVWRRWTNEFLGELHRLRLPGRAIWKMNCRADSVNPEVFAAMRDAGLYLVYMGLESGTDEGLATLNKGMTVEQNLRAVRILKELGLTFEFGFMMFDPSSTFESVRANLKFLRTIIGDGSAAAVFCKMLPYDGTPIKDALEASGRLKGDVLKPDYDFLDPRLEGFYAELDRLIHVSGWIHGYRALSPQLNWAWNEVAVLERLFPPLEETDRYRDDLRKVTKASNKFLFGLVEELAGVHESGSLGQASTLMGPLENDLESRARGFLDQLLEARNGFVALNQDALVRAVVRRPETASAV